MHLVFRDDLVFANKPAGLPSHASDKGRLGFAEIIEAQIEKKIFVVHRLDKTTTGAMVFSTSQDQAKFLFSCFKNHQVKKRYWLIAANRHAEEEFSIESEIVKVGKAFVSRTGKTLRPNSRTIFKRIKGNALFQLYEASPESGKPHQIRLHAQQAGISILGDQLYGGMAYPHLCLHALSLSVEGQFEHLANPPVFFERMGLLRDKDLVAMLAAIDSRQRLFQFLSDRKQMYRLIHYEVPSIVLDDLGESLWLGFYQTKPISLEQLERFEFLSGLLGKPLHLQTMGNRGENPIEKKSFSFGDIKSDWVGHEGNFRFLLKSQIGLSNGLFLDQRANRLTVMKSAQGKSVLNLFSYTCGFSLAAALGHAKNVVSVDVSRNYLEWGKENFKLNHFEPTARNFEFVTGDSLIYLNGALKRQKTFDLIICDPPSFSRGKKSGKTQNLFQIAKDLGPLLKLLWSCLNKNGKILLCSNYEKWSSFDLRKLIELHLPQSKVINGEHGLDFEDPNLNPQMKSFWILKS